MMNLKFGGGLETVGYVQREVRERLPRVPYEGKIDLTYRCNNNCVHCWLKVPSSSAVASKELSLNDLRDIISQARRMGCRSWNISGGEPMIRPDFLEIMGHVTDSSSAYVVNTNGTLITPPIAKALKKRGSVIVAIYGATAKVHDRITRNPGSFEQTLRGCRYLKEAGTSMMIQIIPMRDNYHQYDQMIDLAKRLCVQFKIGASWLYLSASGNKQKNKEISDQRLPPEIAIKLDMPDPTVDETMDAVFDSCLKEQVKAGYLFSSCINGRGNFHIDPYGGMTFCFYIKDPNLRYDLKKGSFKEGWEEFIPSLARKVKIQKEHLDNCGSCKINRKCRCCAVYAYLEHRRFSAKVEYLCHVAKARVKFEDEWKAKHCRFFYSGELTFRVETDLPIQGHSFHPRHKPFETDSPGAELISIRHHFAIPHHSKHRLGKEIYRGDSLAVYRKGKSWIYVQADSNGSEHCRTIQKMAVFNDDYTRSRIYHNGANDFLRGKHLSLTLFPNDDIFLPHILANKGGLYLRSMGFVFNGRGALFLGHSELLDNRILKLIEEKTEAIGKNRILIRKNPSHEFNIYAAWDGEELSAPSLKVATLGSLFFVHHSNKILFKRVNDRRKVCNALLEYLLKPLVTVHWRKKILPLVHLMAEKVPAYSLSLDVKRMGAEKTALSFLETLF